MIKFNDYNNRNSSTSKIEIPRPLSVRVRVVKGVASSAGVNLPPFELNLLLNNNQHWQKGYGTRMGPPLRALKPSQPDYQCALTQTYIRWLMTENNFVLGSIEPPSESFLFAHPKKKQKNILTNRKFNKQNKLNTVECQLGGWVGEKESKNYNTRVILIFCKRR